MEIRLNSLMIKISEDVYTIRNKLNDLCEWLRYAVEFSTTEQFIENIYPKTIEKLLDIYGEKVYNDLFQEISPFSVMENGEFYIELMIRTSFDLCELEITQQKVNLLWAHGAKIVNTLFGG